MRKASKHDDLALMALTWLRNKVTARGMRATTEVCLAEGYVADAVALGGFQYGFLTKYCKAWNKKPIEGTSVWDDVQKKFVYKRSDGISNYFACIFEAKATRSDFLHTFGSGPNHQNRHQPIGSLHWCVTPRKLINPDELPDFWGLLEEYGSGLHEVKKPKLNILAESQMDKIAHQLLWPIQKYRGHIYCERCGAFIRNGFCRRCYIRKIQKGVPK